MDPWEKLKAITGGVSAVIIPIVLLWVGNIYSAALKERELEGQFVALAVSILREAPTDESRNLRKWATDVINEYSGVGLPEEARQDLIDRVRLAASPGVVIPATAETRGFIDYTVFVCADPSDERKTRETAQKIIDTLQAAGSVGEVKYLVWGPDLYGEIDLAELRDRITIIVDEDHPESASAERIRLLLDPERGFPPTRVVANRGAETPWRISLIVCQ